MSLSGDGATALLGAPQARYEAGAADVFHVPNASSWATTSAPAATLTDSALNSCVVPKLTGMTVAAAKKSLTARSCRLGKVARVHAKGKRGHVAAQTEKAGARLLVHAKVGISIVRSPVARALSRGCGRSARRA